MDRGINSHTRSFSGNVSTQQRPENIVSKYFGVDHPASGFAFAPAVPRRPMQLPPAQLDYSIETSQRLPEYQLALPVSARSQLHSSALPQVVPALPGYSSYGEREPLSAEDDRLTPISLLLGNDQHNTASHYPLTTGTSALRHSIAHRSNPGQLGAHSSPNTLSTHHDILANLRGGIPLQTSTNIYPTQFTRPLYYDTRGTGTSTSQQLHPDSHSSRMFGQPMHSDRFAGQNDLFTPPPHHHHQWDSPGCDIQSSPPRMVQQDSPCPPERKTLQSFVRRRNVPVFATPSENTEKSDEIARPATAEEDSHVPAVRHNTTRKAYNSNDGTLTSEDLPPKACGIQLLVPQQALSDREVKSVFPYELFNAVQSKCFVSVYETDDNIVVSAPTGSGKTALLELAICRLARKYTKSNHYKIVYQAPIKSLCSERVRDWAKKFETLGLSVAELTGDTTVNQMSAVRNASIIVTTPEKWDSITRRWKDHVKLLQMVKLFLIDEVHMLSDRRGATLEAVVSRMKTIGANVRFIALSATIPNSDDIAIWLGKNYTNTHLPAHKETFGEEFRPVKLQKHVFGYEGAANDFGFDKALEGKLPNLIAKYNHKKPILIFCMTKKSCEKTAETLADWWTRSKAGDRAWSSPGEGIQVLNKELQNFVSCGVAFHHAGLEPQDRRAVESAFLHGNINVICCTSTLAMGINLPCHLVILKGTACFKDSGIAEYSDLEVMQMLGRAGRPQFDDSAVAIIMTRSKQVERYQKMISGQEILESTLHLNLIAHLNSEIGLGTVQDLHAAKRWLGGTFLSVRMRKNPDYYKIDGIMPGGDSEERLERVCERDIKLLQDHQLVTTDEHFCNTEYGSAMSKYMVPFETMQLLLDIPKRARVEDILICQAPEFKDLKLRTNERKRLRELNKSPLLKYPVKGTICTVAHKVFLITQIQLSGIEIPADNGSGAWDRRQFTLDKNIIFDHLQRLARCVVDCKAYDCDAVATRNALDLARAISADYWENSPLQVRQIPQVGPVTLRKLASNNVTTVEELVCMDSAQIERVIGRNPPFGLKMLKVLRGFPRLTIQGYIVKKLNSNPGETIKVKAVSKVGLVEGKAFPWLGRLHSLTFTAETSNGCLVNFWRGNIKALETGLVLEFIVELTHPEDDIRCRIACDEVVGTLKSIVIKHDIPSSEFPSPKSMRKMEIEPSSQMQQIEEGDEFGGDEYEEEDFLALDNNHLVQIDEGAEFPSIDEVISQPQPNAKPVATNKTPEQEYLRMQNGKFQCNHNCRGGQATKNGHPCKHRCCREGVDRPSRVKPGKRLTDTGREERATVNASRATDKPKVPKKARQGAPLQSKIRMNNSSNKDQFNVEHVDLTNEPEQMPYTSIASHEYRKLNDLRLKSQIEQPTRQVDKEARFEYSTDENIHSFLEPEAEAWMGAKNRSSDPFADSDDSLPPVSQLMRHSQHEGGKMDGYDDMPMDDMKDEFNFARSFPSESMLRGLDTKMGDDDGFHNIGDHLDDMALVTQKSTLSKLPTASFVESVVDFSSCSEPQTNTTISSAQCATKRNADTSLPSPEPVHKQRRLTSDEAPCESVIQKSIPAWVSEFDSELIAELGDLIEFED